VGEGGCEFGCDERAGGSASDYYKIVVGFVIFVSFGEGGVEFGLEVGLAEEIGYDCENGDADV